MSIKVKAAAAPTDVNKFLDKGERFGFMKRGKASRCHNNGCRIMAEDSRVYDNKNKKGAFCLPCAYRLLKEPEAGITPEDFKKLMAAIADLAGEVRELLDRSPVKRRSNPVMDMSPGIPPPPPASAVLMREKYPQHFKGEDLI